MTVAVGVDVGGTKCLGVAIVDGEVIAEDRRPTPNGDAVIETIASMMSDLGKKSGSIDLRFGLGIAGLVGRDGKLYESPHLSLAPRTDIASRLGDLVGSSVVVHNDATAAAFAEWSVGSAVRSDSCVCVTLGTGIGVGVVVGGEPLVGSNGFVGEMGHMCIDRNGGVCKCGQRGCWELYASGTALNRAAVDAGFTAESLADSARNGDARAMRVMTDFADFVALGLATITYAFDPDLIVIGGGVSTSADVLEPLLQECLASHVYSASARPLPHVVPALLGERASAIGAALLA